jgi:DNA-binding Xre family transcriptional regulator
MSVATKWDTREYQRIAAVERDGEALVVCFEDGSRVSVDPRILLPASSTVDWDGLTANPYEIVVPGADGPMEVSWAAIRALTDRDYAAHLAAAAEEQARQVGLRIKELRQQRGLSSKELAERAGIAPQSLSRIEHGRHDVVFTTLRRILAAMGCSLRDLAKADA